MHNSIHDVMVLQAGKSNGELASWEELALQHGTEAVIILSDSNHREPILTARSSATEPSGLSTLSVDSSAVPMIVAAGPAKAARTGSLDAWLSIAASRQSLAKAWVSLQIWAADLEQTALNAEREFGLLLELQRKG